MERFSGWENVPVDELWNVLSNHPVFPVEENFVILMLDTFESTALTDVLNEDEARYGGMLDDLVKVARDLDICLGD